jgi:hypothetical protein
MHSLEQIREAAESLGVELDAIARKNAEHRSIVPLSVEHGATLAKMVRDLSDHMILLAQRAQP